MADFVYVADTDDVFVLVEVTETDAAGVADATSLRGSLPFAVSVAAIMRLIVLS